MRILARATFAALAFAGMTDVASAASLQVAPTTVEIPMGSSASTLMLKNPGKAPLKAQIRVYRWSLAAGEEKLEPANDVVASPPMVSVKPGTDYTVRLVRLNKAPVQSEETYRVIIDEIPDPSQRAAGVVQLAFRYSIPVFFLPGANAKGQLTWSVERRNGKLVVSATNTGARRVRLADLKAVDDKGKSAVIAKGLAGYVLARSSKSWVAPNTLNAGASSLQISAQGDLGPINAQAKSLAAR